MILNVNSYYLLNNRILTAREIPKHTIFKVIREDGMGYHIKILISSNIDILDNVYIIPILNNQEEIDFQVIESNNVTNYIYKPRLNYIQLSNGELEIITNETPVNIPRYYSLSLILKFNDDDLNLPISPEPSFRSNDELSYIMNERRRRYMNRILHSTLSEQPLPEEPRNIPVQPTEEVTEGVTETSGLTTEDINSVLTNIVGTETSDSVYINDLRTFRTSTYTNHIYTIDPYARKVSLANEKAKYVKESISSNGKITNELLLSIFKYIPIMYDGNYGFYDPKNEKLVYFKNYNQLRRTNNSKFSIIVKYTKINNVFEYLDINSLFMYCKFKVKSCNDSIKLFKYKKLKNEMLNKEYPGTKLGLLMNVKKSDVPVNTIYLNNNNKNTRFLLSDIEIIYPNINGYYPKKDRTITKGSNVKVINDKHSLHLKKGEKVKVLDLKKVGNKTYAGIKIKNNIIYERLNKFKKIC